jgi:hypothetical protein
MVAAPSLERKHEDLITNWHLISKLPKEISFYEIGRPLSGMHEVAVLASRLPIPAAEHERLLVGFARLDEFQSALGPETPIRTRHVCDFPSFLDGNTGEDGPAIYNPSHETSPRA